MKRKLLVVLLACAMLSSCGVNNVGNNGIHMKNGDAEVSIGKDGIIAKSGDSEAKIGKDGIIAKNGDSEANVSAEGVKVQNGLDLEGEDPVTKEKRKNNVFLDEDKIFEMEIKENSLDKDDIKDWEIKLDKESQTYTVKYNALHHRHENERDAVTGQLLKGMTSPTSR
ncbi:hypothetical protein GKG03_07655 [Finegoldia sp. BIOML-A3]|uniref:hypothetical protein n=1 Tax=unclassified Finegoldia TaxID=2619637 RepID=UPI0012B0F32C|nr:MULTISPECIES: hypothetical protein [unclassified Finegoldia]MSA99555.1 hypothetical protein [Finegoldia sp. BIOML-A3]MSB92447.1 hypothetical protein [Finegoldia sp. BIOML-A4]